jgi:hypothetical protein
MKNQSIATILNEIIQDHGTHNKINTLIYCKDKKVDFKKVRKIVTRNNNKKIAKADILTNNYFHKKLSLSQNIRFNSTLSDIATEPFLNKYSLKEQFEQLKHNNFEEIDSNAWFQFEVLLYIHTQKELLIEKNNFFSVVNDILIDSLSLLKGKQIFFLSSNSIKQLQQIRQFFEVFMHITDNELQIYNNFENFSDAFSE